MPYKDKNKRKEASCKAMQRKRQGLTEGLTKQGLTPKSIKGLTRPKGKVSQAEIDALPADVKQYINRLCDSDPVRYDDKQDRLTRTALYQRQFPESQPTGRSNRYIPQVVL